MRTEQLEALRRALVEGPVRGEAAQVYADALEQAGHPFAPFARGRQACTEAELPEEIAGWLLGGRRGLTERLVLEDGVLREVRFVARRTPEMSESQLRLRAELLEDGIDYELFDGYAQRSVEVVELIGSEACRGLTRVSGLIFDTFKRLCEEEVELRQVAVLADDPGDWDHEFWWCGTEAESDPPVGRLRMRELVLERGGGRAGDVVRWLQASCRPVFDRLERLRAPETSEVCVAALKEGHGRALRSVETHGWSATRDERGWHLVVGTPADGERLYEDLNPESELDGLAGFISSLAEVIADVRVQGPQLPEGELRVLELAAKGKPIHFELGHPAEATTRLTRGLPPRRFDAGAPLLSREMPY